MELSVYEASSYPALCHENSSHLGNPRLSVLLPQLKKCTEILLVSPSSAPGLETLQVLSWIITIHLICFLCLRESSLSSSDVHCLERYYFINFVQFFQLLKTEESINFHLLHFL